MDWYPENWNVLANISEYLILSELTFEWSESYDDKDWARLQAILAPTLMVNNAPVQPIALTFQYVRRLTEPFRSTIQR